MRIRELDEKDRAFLRRCVMDLQEIERALDPRLPAGEEMVDAYCADLLARRRAWNGVIFVAEEHGVPAALLAIYLHVPETEADEPKGPRAVITDLFVVPEARGRGVGSALLEHGVVHAREAGAPVLRLEVMAANAAARRFYARHGWVERVIQLEKAL
jgi:ribosomal protein S18 acetylase RimI-like enzyme